MSCIDPEILGTRQRNVRAGEAVAGDDAAFQCQGHKQPPARVIYGHDWLQPSNRIALRTGG